jgi:hypothetical protein
MLLTVGGGVGAGGRLSEPGKFLAKFGKGGLPGWGGGVMRHSRPSNNPPVTLLPSDGN